MLNGVVTRHDIFRDGGFGSEAVTLTNAMSALKVDSVEKTVQSHTEAKKNPRWKIKKPRESPEAARAPEAENICTDIYVMAS